MAICFLSLCAVCLAVWAVPSQVLLYFRVDHITRSFNSGENSILLMMSFSRRFQSQSYWVSVILIISVLILCERHTQHGEVDDERLFNALDLTAAFHTASQSATTAKKNSVSGNLVHTPRTHVGSGTFCVWRHFHRSTHRQHCTPCCSLALSCAVTWFLRVLSLIKKGSGAV